MHDLLVQLKVSRANFACQPTVISENLIIFTLGRKLEVLDQELACCLDFGKRGFLGINKQHPKHPAREPRVCILENPTAKLES